MCVGTRKAKIGKPRTITAKVVEQPKASITP